MRAIPLPLAVKQAIKVCAAVLMYPWTLLAAKLAVRRCRQLEVGSGGKRREGWITLDLVPGADLLWNLNWRLPFDDASLDRVYCEHVLEHFTLRQAERVLADIRRVLRPGGSLLVSVPDLDVFLEASARGDASLATFKPAFASSRPADILNYIFYMGGEHRFMYNLDNLRHHLERLGYTNVALRAFDPSLDDPARQRESLLAGCTR